MTERKGRIRRQKLEGSDDDNFKTPLTKNDGSASSSGYKTETTDSTPDDERVIDEVEEHKRIAKKLREQRSDETSTPSLQTLLDQSEQYLGFVLARSRNRHSKVKEPGELASIGKKKKTKRMKESDEDSILLQEAEEAISGKRHTYLLQQPSCMEGQLKPYQIEGLNWLIDLYENGLNGILADEMGLGKTCQAISLLAYLRESRGIKGPHLILAPKSTLGNWHGEIQKFCPSIKTLKFHGTPEERAELRTQIPDCDAILTSYEICTKEVQTLSEFQFKYIIVDEAHRLKNEESRLSHTARQIPSMFRLLLTGTPLQNNLKELWALLNFLYPEIFSSSEEFENLFNLTTHEEYSSVAKERKNAEIISRLHNVLRPFMLRRVKSEIDVEIPPKKELILFVPMAPMQKKLYKNLLLRNVDALNDSQGARVSLLNTAMQLLKACNHPYLFDGQEDKTLDPFGEHLVRNSGKMMFLDKLLTRLVERGSRCLIFSQMARLLDILEDYCRMRNHDYCRLDGNTSGADRDSQIAEFNAPDSSKKIFILSTRAGGLGINLATADSVILYDSDWNPQVDLQAMDRAHRIGQKKPVNVYRFIHEHTIEEKVLERASLKLQLDTAVIQQGRLSDKSKHVSKKQLTNMIQFGANFIFKAGEALDLDETDLEAILETGEKKTAEMNKKIQNQVSKSLLDFSIGPGGSKIYEFEGIDYEESQKKQDHEAWLEQAKGSASLEERSTKRRVRQQQEQIEQLKQDMLQMAKKEAEIKEVSQRVLQMHDWQFFDRHRIHQLNQIEHRHVSSGGTTYDLTDEQREERDSLLASGFGDWSRKDFLNFVRGCELYGREDFEGIASECVGKSVTEIIAYSEVFWEKYYTFYYFIILIKLIINYTICRYRW
eukprot:GHVP01003179.1.p1 GENE.GHVP01003179.1~~GHVP01003179.1.p1  ORF type:complete len:887 (+),score=164.26 GHVP01003179.1:33-2693(+)